MVGIECCVLGGCLFMTPTQTFEIETMICTSTVKVRGARCVDGVKVRVWKTFENACVVRV